MDKKQSRLRRARRTRAHIKDLAVTRLCVHKTPRHMYAQIISPEGNAVIASASTLDKDVRKDVEKTGGAAAAMVVGKVVAERARAAGVSRVAFDRSGFKFHGRVKALADAARENGLEF
jgi:large subunit ribosomal protein L18